ncbi:MAG: DUF72 domain-containing protein [Cereibacter sphaeroides]|uniref:DUF72 domain-containing protein n=1 Tax=Cereibacter sphaeroides TaxID=1063 RepID=A0A2W5UAF6_CERSP|nr:MAG: DUF72 domain-containing protein [Cereibacter sphaeroides]
MEVGRIRVGIGGWVYDPWRGTFYPDGLTQSKELDYASRHLTAIEINGTFYRSPSAETYVKWYEESGPGVVFSLKAPRYSTNRKVLAEGGESIHRFIESGLTGLKEKLGPINWQLAPTKKFDPVDFAAFLDILPERVGDHVLRHAVEVRHDTFRHAEAVDIARERGVAIVMAGDSEYPQIADPTADFIYARIMGTTEDHETGYGKAALDLWAARAKAWAKGEAAEGLQMVGAAKADGKPRDVYLYVISGHKVTNPAAAMEIIRRV